MCGAEVAHRCDLLKVWEAFEVKQCIAHCFKAPERCEPGRGRRKPLRKFQKSHWALPGAHRKPVSHRRAVPAGPATPCPFQARFGDVVVFKAPVLTLPFAQRCVCAVPAGPATPCPFQARFGDVVVFKAPVLTLPFAQRCVSGTQEKALPVLIHPWGREFRGPWPAGSRLCERYRCGAPRRAVLAEAPGRERLLQRPPPRQLVYVFTTWRSGSSFFGELFNQNPEVFFLYEPVWHVWQKLYPGDAVSLQGAARDMLSSLYRCDLSVFQLYSTAGSGKNLTTLGIFGAATNKVICSSPLCPAYRKEVVGMVDDRVCKKCPPQRLSRFQEECHKYRTLVIKGVRVFDLAVLAPLMRDPTLDLKVIHLVRDPRAVASSRIKSRHGLIRESLQVVRSRDPHIHRMPFLDAGHKLGGKKEGGGGSDYHALGAMEVICSSMAKTLQTALHPPDWLQGNYMAVRYEDLVVEPIKTLRQVYGFVNLAVSPDMEKFALNMTSGPGYSSKPFVVSARNASQALSAWRTALSYQQIKQVEEYCQQPMALLGYERVGSPEEVKDLSRTLLRKPRL
ncbi:PREDICTED: carbohydrate sulfotransferase 2 [Ficedula albicollis]|nr:PREDICTED: carbohydrate sulfotransferase 2 [Ficedula albicollis]